MNSEFECFCVYVDLIHPVYIWETSKRGFMRRTAESFVAENNTVGEPNAYTNITWSKKITLASYGELFLSSLSLGTIRAIVQFVNVETCSYHYLKHFSIWSNTYSRPEMRIEHRCLPTSFESTEVLSAGTAALLEKQKHCLRIVIPRANHVNSSFRRFSHISFCFDFLPVCVSRAFFGIRHWMLRYQEKWRG